MTDDFDAEIEEAAVRVAEAMKALDDKKKDATYMEKLAAAKAAMEAANARREELSKKVEARRDVVLLEKQILVRAEKGNLVANPDLIKALLAEANLSEAEVQNMKNPHTIEPFRLRDTAFFGPLDVMVQQMSQRAIKRDGEAARLTQEYNEAVEKANSANNTHWHIDRQLINLVDSLEHAKANLSRAQSRKEDARIAAEERAKARAERKASPPDPDAAARREKKARLDNGKQVLHDIFTGARPFVWPQNATPTPDEKLAILREKWEKGYTVEGAVKDETGALLVSLSKKDRIGREEYALHRYFVVGGEWQVSVDYKGDAKDMERKE